MKENNLKVSDLENQIAIPSHFVAQLLPSKKNLVTFLEQH